MTVPSSRCEAKKHAYRQTQDGIVVSFVLHPNEVPDDLALAPLGTRYMLALARIGDDEEPQEPEQKPEKPKRPGRPFADIPPSQQTGILCNDSEFQKWTCPGNPCPRTARNNILSDCKIKSRKELDSNGVAHGLWDAMMVNFCTATGRPIAVR